MSQHVSAYALGAARDALRAVGQRSQLVGAVVPGAKPMLCFQLPPGSRRSRLERGFHALAWGWDLTFGAALTVAAVTREGWLGRVYVTPADAAFADLAKGSAVALFLAEDRLLGSFELDLASSAPEDDYAAQIARVRDHVPTLEDSRACWWDTLTHQQMVVESALRPEDRLSLGWVARYRKALHHLEWILEQAPKDALERIPLALAREQHPGSRALFEAMVSTRAAAAPLVRWASALQDSDPSAFIDFHVSGAEIHRAFHDALGDHSSLCQLHARLLDVNALMSARTGEGRHLSWLSKESRTIDRIELTPRRFPSDADPSQYWPRIEAVPPWNWGELITGADMPADLGPASPAWTMLPRAESLDENEDAADALLAEAISSKKWTIPAGAEIELPIGPFTRMTAFEIDDEVFFILRNERAEFAIASVEPSNGFIGFSGTFAASELGESTRAALKLLLAAVIRDFFVVEERESVFAHVVRGRTGRRRMGEADGPRVVYLPRVRYTSKPDVSRCSAEVLGPAVRRKHDVGMHMRRVGRPSQHQLFLAQAYGFSVPAGYTFVRPHHRGEQARDVVYRSRSALQALYEAEPTPAVPRVAAPAPWFAFERDVATLLQSAGFTVEHVSASRRGDGGVDVYARKGEDLEAVNWVIQCKCYAASRSVGPQIVRELVGALADFPRGTRGMIVTTSSFTADASELAARSGIRLMDGAEFVERLRSTSS